MTPGSSCGGYKWCGPASVAYSARRRVRTTRWVLLLLLWFDHPTHGTTLSCLNYHLDNFNLNRFVTKWIAHRKRMKPLWTENHPNPPFRSSCTVPSALYLFQLLPMFRITHHKPDPFLSLCTITFRTPEKCTLLYIVLPSILNTLPRECDLHSSGVELALETCKEHSTKTV